MIGGWLLVGVGGCLLVLDGHWWLVLGDRWWLVLGNRCRLVLGNHCWLVLGVGHLSMVLYGWLTFVSSVVRSSCQSLEVDCCLVVG